MQETGQAWIQRGPSLTGMGVQVRIPNTWEIEAERSEVQSHARLHSKFNANQGSWDLFQNIKQNTRAMSWLSQ